MALLAVILLGFNAYRVAEFERVGSVSISRSGSFELAMTPDKALPLFTGPGEELWVDHWAPLYLAGDGYKQGSMFLTKGHGKPVHWYVSQYDEIQRRAQYVRVMPGKNMGTVTVDVLDNGQGGSIVKVKYDLASLSLKENKALANAFSEQNYAQMMREWKRMVEANMDKINRHYES